MLLLGGNGLIGKAINREAVERGWSVTVTVRYPVERANYVVAVGDLQLKDILCSRIWDFVIDLRAFDASSTRAAVEHLCGQSTYVLLSSIYAYCHPRTYGSRNLRGLSEGAPLHPTGPYGIGKVAAEATAMEHAVCTNVYVIRLPFIFGTADRSGRTDRMWQLARTGCDDPNIDFEIGLVSAATVSCRLMELAEKRPPGRHVLNVDGGRNWTLRAHLHAAARAVDAREIRSTLPGSPEGLELPFNPGRDFSLNSVVVHQLLDIPAVDDLDREWKDVADLW